MTDQLTAVYVKQGEWYVAYLEEIPGVNTQGASLEDARTNLSDALHEYMEANRMLANSEIQGKLEVTRETFASIESAA